MSEGGFLDPGIPDGESCSYRGVVDGSELGSGVGVVFHTGEGRRSGYRQELSINLEAGLRYEVAMEFMLRSGRLRAESYKIESHDGKHPLAGEESNFADVKALGFGGDVARYPHNLTPLLGCGLALRGLEFEKNHEREISVLLASSFFWEVAVKVEREESVSVPAGDFKAWRVRVRPSFERLGGTIEAALAMVLPPVTLHFECDAPHRLLMIDFPTGPFPDNPRGLIEATEL